MSPSSLPSTSPRRREPSTFHLGSICLLFRVVFFFFGQDFTSDSRMWPNVTHKMQGHIEPGSPALRLSSDFSPRPPPFFFESRLHIAKVACTSK